MEGTGRGDAKGFKRVKSTDDEKLSGKRFPDLSAQRAQDPVLRPTRLHRGPAPPVSEIGLKRIRGCGCRLPFVLCALVVDPFASSQAFGGLRLDTVSSNHTNISKLRREGESEGD